MFTDGRRFGGHSKCCAPLVFLGDRERGCSSHRPLAYQANFQCVDCMLLRDAFLVIVPADKGPRKNGR